MPFLSPQKTFAQFLRLCFFVGFLTSTAAAVTVFTKRVAASADDAEQISVGNPAQINSTDLEIRAASAYTGMRFNNVTIPQGATITKAYLELEAYTPDTDPTVGTFYGEDANDAAAFTATLNNITDRTKTTASVSWNPIPNFTVDTVYSSPSLVSIISEITSRSGWASGNDLVILFEYASGPDRREISSYDGDIAHAPYLVVEYSAIQAVWDGGGGNSSWINDVNWVGDPPNPTNGEDIVFAGTTQLSVDHNYTAWASYNSFTFASGAGAFTLSGNGITFGGNITNSSAYLQTMSVDLALSGSCTVNAASGDIALSGIISGTSGLTKSGTATLTLSGTNTYTGTTTISAGTLKTQGGAFPGAARIYSIASGAMLIIDGTTTMASGTSTINGAGTLRITGGTFEAFSSGLHLTMSMSSGGLIDVQSGATFTNGGWQSITWTSNLADLNVDGNFNVHNGNGIYVDALTGYGSVSHGYGDLTTLNIGVNNGSGTFSGVISNAAGTTRLTKTGTGIQTFSGTNTYTGTTTINAGTLKAGIATQAFGVGSAVTLADAANTSLDITGFDNTISSLSGGGVTGGNVILGAATLTTGANSTTYTGVISGTGGITKTGNGTFTLAGTSTYTGATTVNGGTLLVTGSLAAGSAVTINSGGTFGGTGTVAGTITANTGGTIAPGTGGTAIGTIHTANVTMSGSSVYSVNLDGLTSTGDQVSSSGTVACAGTLTVANIINAAVDKVYVIITGASVTGTFTGMPDLATFSTPSGRNFQIDYTGTQVSLKDLGSGSGGVDTHLWSGNGGSPFNWNTGNNWTSGIVPTPGDMLQFDGTKGNSNTNNIAAGTSFGSITFNPGATTFTLKGQSITLDGNITNSSPTLQIISLDMVVTAQRTIALTTGDITIGGVISGTGGGMKVTGDGHVLTLSGANIYTGETSIGGAGLTYPHGPTVSVSSDANLGNGGSLNVGTDGFGILKVNGPSFTSTARPVTWGSYGGEINIADAGNTLTLSQALGHALWKTGPGKLVLTGNSTFSNDSGLAILASTVSIGNGGTSGSAGGIIRNGGALEFNRSDASSFNGVISGTGTVTKLGAGMLTLSGINTCTGAISISAGTLNVTGSIASGSVTVGLGATLAGTGTLAGAVTVSNGGIAAPGNGTTGTLATGPLTLRGTSVLNFELAAPGSCDKIAVTGNLTLDGTLNVTALSGFAEGSYTLLTCDGTLTDNGLTLGSLPAGFTGSLSVVAKTVVLTVTSTSNLPTILTDPAGLQKYIGENATFTVSASGSGLTYQWQRSADGTNWSNVTGGTGGTTATYTFTTQASDANALFHCVVSNTYGTVTSASARLKLCASISAPADQLNKKTGETASFSVSPSADVISYSWWRSPDGITWTQIGSAAGNTYTMTVTAADTLVKFQCRMTDSCGTQTSATATLTACTTPLVTVHPVNDSAIETQSARFKITATGSGRTYKWQRMPGGGAWTAIPGATSDSVAITATKADSGAQFRCVVSNACDSATSNAATLKVFTKAKANFSMSIGGKIDSIGFAPDTVGFTDLSSGNDSMWIWSYGDGKRDTSRVRGEIKTHAYENPGQYPVVLVVQGLGGRDSISRTLTLYSKGGNPIKITGQRLTDNSVRLVFSNFGTLKAPGETPPTVNTIKLWYQAGAIPLDSTSGAKALAPYSLVTLRSGGTSYSATVNVPSLVSPNTKYGFITQIVWDNNGGTTPFDTLNGCLVLMSEARPENRLVVSGAYVPWDTVKFFMDSIQTIGASSDSVGLWYGMGGDSVPDFARTNPNVTWWSVAEIKTMVVGNRFAFTRQDTRFNTDQSILRVAVVIKSLSKLQSDRVDGTVAIGRVRPSNPIILSATAQTALRGTIALTWSYKNPDTVDKIRIYYRTGSAIPVNQYNFSGLDSIVLLPNGPMTDTVKNLAGSTRYYFGAQIYKQGMWSVVTSSSSASDSTPEAAAATIRNTITVTRAEFDSATNKFLVSWKIDTSKTSLTPVPVPTRELRIGFSLSTVNVSLWERIGQNQRAVTSDTGSVVLDMGDSLVFNKDIYVFLWLQKTGQQWVNPTDSSTRIVPTRSFVWQAVHYNFTTTGDTSLWANSQIRFISAPVSTIYMRNWQDTIRAFTAPAGTAGFVNVGSSFVFAQNNMPERFDVGLKSTLPAGRQWQEVFVYRYDTTAGKWMVDRATQRDTVNGYVYVNTNQLERPFGVFIDTQRPVVKVTDTSTAPVNKADAVNYTVEVSDNVGNLKWSFESTKGGEPFSRGTAVDMTLTSGIDTAHVTIPANQVSDDNGVIARFICEDGTYSDTIDLSRQVVRQASNSDLQWTSALKWVPLRVTAQLDSPQAKRLLRFIDTVAPDPQYNDRYMRLFRWYPNASNIVNDDRWVEYSKASVPDSVFDFKSGRLMWMKSREKRLLQFGRAVTMSQKVPDTVPLFARDWTDFALPYRYNMRIGDIIAAMRSAGSKYADSLQIYNWVRSPAGKYGAEIFFSSLPGNDSLARVMLCTGDNIGFTVYNPSNSVEKLVIPPISENMSAYRAANLKSAAGAGRGMWAVRILPLTADGAALTSVYCGYTANRSGSRIFYPVAPSFDGIGVSVIEEKSGRVCGHKMSGDLRGGGCSYLLMFGNGSQSTQTIRCTFERTGDFPAAMKTAVYNSQTGETVDPGNGELSVSVDGGSREYRWLFAGDAQYIASAGRERAGGKLALTSVYPNPVRRFTHVLYTLPFGRVARVDFTVLDIMGRTVWHKSIRETSVLGGRRDYVWYGCGTNGRRVAAGVYVLKMVAADSKGKAVGVFNRRLTVLP